jgi:hypothetical protein
VSSLIPLAALWKQTPKQKIFHACPVYEVMYGGQKGGGKTDALLFDHVEQHALAHGNWEATHVKTRGRALILRKEFGRLADFMARAHTYFPVMSREMMKWQEQKHTWLCACGYRVWFGHCEGPQDHELYQGQEISRLAVDQVEEIPYHQYAYIKLQVRSSEPLIQPTVGVRCSANPLGRYADWVKKRFVDKNRNGYEVMTEEVEVDPGPGQKKVKVVRDRVFIPAGVRDNPHLPPEYIAELMLAPEHMRRAFLDGDWDVTPGSFFGDVFDNRLHVIDDLGPNEIRIPSNWPIFRCGDGGSRNPAACYWLAVDNDGLIIVLDELYGPGEEPKRWASKILQVEEKWGWLDSKGYSKVHGYLDPACFKADTAGGPTIAEKLFEAGLSWFEGDNSRKAGWTELRRRLMERGGIANKTPGLRITRRCKDLIRTLPNLTAPDRDSGGDGDDIDTKQEDHAADAIRYGVMSRPMPKFERNLKDEELARWERITAAQRYSDDTRSTTTGY